MSRLFNRSTEKEMSKLSVQMNKQIHLNLVHVRLSMSTQNQKTVKLGGRNQKEDATIPILWKISDYLMSRRF